MAGCDAMGTVIEELVVPDGDLDAAFPAYAEHFEVRNANEAAVLGAAAPFVDPREMLPYFHDQGRLRKRLYVARLDGEVVGQALFERSLDPSDPVGWIYGGVLVRARNQGVGTALFDRVEADAIASGSTTLQSFVLHGDATGPRVTARAGVGDLPQEDPGVRFVRGRGWQLGQVVQWNVLDLPFDPEWMEALWQAALRAAGLDYRIRTWVGLSPDERLAGLAELAAAMERDVPRGDLDGMISEWTPERVRRDEEREAAGGRSALTAVAEHVPTGMLVGMTRLSLPSDLAHPVKQKVTIVRREHRGRRLGILLKVANLRLLRDEVPEASLVVTTNAAENRQMLAINIDLGFRTVGYTGAWKKVITPARTRA